MQVPMMPNLRHLKLSKGREQPWSLSVCALLKSTPQLEQLYLENLFLDCKLPNDEKFDESCVPNLKSVTISDMKVMVFERGDNNLWLQQGHSAALEANRLVTALNGGKKLKALDIHYNWQYTDREDAAFDVFSRMLQDPSYQYEDLEILRLSKLVLAPQTAERLFGSSVRSGKLSSFDICFPLPTFNETEGRTSLEHIRKYQWLEGAESIRCLGIYDFCFKRYLKGSEHPLIQFLQTFPLLEEVKLGSTSSGGPEYYYTVSDILSLVKLKRVEISDIHGSSFDRLRRMARDEATILTWEAQPPKWPLSFKYN
ncbi:hypothetical protein THARTR1_06312 [Trichoderma harzianum]|uniref:F-box domain-containing protein n=1 Tax=Trichoderma harzianum TaxID=5544 RepID=A0A2K0U5N6_TRIHA|nr:hypothetical protein THARTR1_06312 [Trichoderma harzianum]